MSKQTAVEWLVEKYEQTIGESISSVMADEILIALQMEREQIEDAWNDGRSPFGALFLGDYLENTYGKEASDEKHS